MAGGGDLLSRIKINMLFPTFLEKTFQLISFPDDKTMMPGFLAFVCHRGRQSPWGNISAVS